MRKKLAAGIAMLLVLSMTGCETLPKKFIRKKKKAEHTPSVVYLDEGPYQKKFSNDYYYKLHYTLWKSWQGEIVANLGGNSKRLNRAAQEAYSHLEQMAAYLKPEKKAEFMPLVEELGKYRAKIESSPGSKSEAMSLRADLERLQRHVANDFYYEKVKEHVLTEQVDLS